MSIIWSHMNDDITTSIICPMYTIAKSTTLSQWQTCICLPPTPDNCLRFICWYKANWLFVRLMLYGEDCSVLPFVAFMEMWVTESMYLDSNLTLHILLTEKGSTVPKNTYIAVEPHDPYKLLFVITVEHPTLVMVFSIMHTTAKDPN